RPRRLRAEESVEVLHRSRNECFFRKDDGAYTAGHRPAEFANVLVASAREPAGFQHVTKERRVTARRSHHEYIQVLAHRRFSGSSRSSGLPTYSGLPESTPRNALR